MIISELFIDDLLLDEIPILIPVYDLQTILFKLEQYLASVSTSHVPSKAIHKFLVWNKLEKSGNTQLTRIPFSLNYFM